MRPTPSSDVLPAARSRSRKSSVADHPAHTAAAHNVPTSFFLRSEEEMEKSLSNSTSMIAAGKQKDSTYGVQSLADALESAFGDTTSNENGSNKADASGRNVDKQPARPRTPSRSSQRNLDTRQGDSSPKHASPRKPHPAQASSSAIPTSLPSSRLDSPEPESAIHSTPRSMSLKSFQLSDEESGADESASQAIVSSEDDEEDTHIGQSGSFPQLVMPSIQMPSRRPFTEKGKYIGRLKVLIAGEAGAGKTSLLRSIVQICEDIVHVDPLSPTQPDSPPPKAKSRRRKVEAIGTTRIIEVNASTRAYPSWWSDMEESRVSRRRKSMGDTVLERNLCFIDTPGYGKNGPDSDNMDLVVEYLESLFHRNASIGAMSDGDLLGLMGGNGGLHVDVVFYLISPKDDMSADIDYIQRLSVLTNVIPLISKADTLTSSQVLSLKNTLLTRLQATSTKPFLFGKTLQESLLAVQARTTPSPGSSPERDANKQAESPQIPNYLSVSIPPYAISSTPGPDTETMDASLLMSPDYVQPLLPSELTVLVNQVFNPDTISWLRHSAAKKFISWRSRTNFPGDSMIMHGYPQQRGLNSLGLNTGGLGGKSLQDPFSRLTTAPPSSASSIFSAASPSGVLVPHPHSPFYLSHANSNSNLHSPYPASSPALSHSPLHDLEGPSDFSLTRFRDHTQREERFAQVRLAKWAGDLQRSLRNERERFEELQRGERAKWLLERVSEEVRDGSIVSSPSSSARADWAVVRHGSEKRMSGPGARYGCQRRVDSRDPLGLCDFTDEVKRRGSVLFRVIGGVGVLGAVVVAVVKMCGLETRLGLPENGVWGWLVGSGE